VRSDYPFEYRWLGDNSVTESYAMLMDHRMQDRGWLLRYTELGSANVDNFLRLAGFEELHYIRRYCAKLIYEVQAYGDNADWKDLPDLYVETLTSATNFRYRTADAFIEALRQLRTNVPEQQLAELLDVAEGALAHHRLLVFLRGTHGTGRRGAALNGALTDRRERWRSGAFDGKRNEAAHRVIPS